jgi:hypothetical protein
MTSIKRFLMLQFNMRHLLTCALLCFLTTGMVGCFGGCGETEEEQSLAEKIQKQIEESIAENTDGDSEAPESLKEGLEGLGEALEGIGNAIKEGGNVEPIDFRLFKEMAPESGGGLKFVKGNGEKTGTLGVKMSRYKAEYEDGEGGRANLEFIDMGTLKGAAMLGYGWLMTEIDREGDDGMERTLKYKGYPAHQKMQRRGERISSEMAFIVGERFVVKADGNVELERIESLLDEVPEDDLEDMKDEGVTSD